MVGTRGGFKRTHLPLVRWLCVLLYLVLPGPDSIGAASMDEYAVKAAYIYNFTRFTEWPRQSPPSPFSLCILGRSPFGDALADLQGKPVGERPLHVRHLGRAGRYEDCQMVFISRSERHRLKPLLFDLRGQPVLTVSDIENFTRNGGMIGLVQRGQRIAFAVNLDPVRQAGLKISSKLLRLATHVLR